jgi:predicted DNA-binding transcriptional regulator YafY
MGIYCDIKCRQLSAVDIVGKVGVGYLLQSGFAVPSLFFSEKEQEARFSGIRLVKGRGYDRLISVAVDA